jgi:hypothetical protein
VRSPLDVIAADVTDALASEPRRSCIRLGDRERKRMRVGQPRFLVANIVWPVFLGRTDKDV